MNLKGKKQISLLLTEDVDRKLEKMAYDSLMNKSLFMRFVIESMYDAYERTGKLPSFRIEFHSSQGN